MAEQRASGKKATIIKATKAVTRSVKPAQPGVESRLRVPAQSCVERSLVFADGSRLPGSFGYERAWREVQARDNAFVWLALRDPSQSQMVDIARTYGVNDFIVEDAVTGQQRPKFERYEDQIFLVIGAVAYHPHESVLDTKTIIETGQVQLIIGDRFVISVHHGKGTQIPKLVANDEELISRHGPIAVAWKLADALVDRYLSIAGELMGDVNELEDALFQPEMDLDVRQIYVMKREILEMRHVVDPLQMALKLVLADSKDLLTRGMRSHFRDVLDHQIIAADRVVSYDERLSSLISAGTAMVSVQQNSDMRTISAWVGMAAVPTLIAGIYGMNFVNMPELENPHGYYYSLLLMAGVVIVLFWLFKRNKWL